MIVLQIKGRLGNQMFRYAFLRQVMCIRQSWGIEDRVILDLSAFNGYSTAEGWEDSLKYFNVINYTTVDYKYIYKHGSTMQKCLSKLYYAIGKLGAVVGRNCQIKLQNLISPMLFSQGVLYSLDSGVNLLKSRYLKHKTIYIDGLFENKYYFNSIKHILLKEFTPKYSLLPQNSKLYNIITSTNSVCISIRRGDFIHNFNGVYDVCTPSYFIKAIELAKRLIDNPSFIFFSDDIEWVKNNIKIKDCLCYYESGADPIWEKLRLMQACKNFIISNSTFSYWVQYLSNNTQKIVISPSRWYNDNRPAHLIDNTFICVD